jgi:LPS-assembly protein
MAMTLFFSGAALASNPFAAPAGGGTSGDTKSGDMLNFKLNKAKSVELQADQVQYSVVDSKAQARGNVVVTADQTILTCDQLELDRILNVGVAQGHVYIDSPQSQVDASEGTYNFNDQSGSFKNARIYQFPYQINGKVVDRMSPEHVVMHNGYLTTSDHDAPFFRIASRKIDVYPGDKAIARDVKVYLGKVPVMYWPKYTQDLKDKPWITFLPGRSKDFGTFLLVTIRQRIGDNGKLTLHLDERERKGQAYGFDYKYNTARYGSGIVRFYFMHERGLTAKHAWQDKPIVKTQRYKLEWRHKWEPDKNTNILMQYYRVTDATFLKQYFERQNRQDPDINTYFLLTRNLPKGTFTFDIEASNVNHFARGVQRLPEIKYELSDTEIGNTGFYAQTTNTFSNLTRKTAGAPDPETEDSQKTMRFDTKNQISYPMKIAFVELRPYAGGENTYYSRTANLAQRNIIRGQFFTGADASTKFYRTWNVHRNFWGVEINGLRHIVTPTAAYLYKHRPTFSSTHLNSFDSIDSADKQHTVTLGLENKLQTKRNGVSVDLLRTLVSSNFALKENPGKGGFGPVTSDVEFKPADWLQFNADASYDHHRDYFTAFNFDTSITGKTWNFGIGQRYDRSGDDQITTEWNYKINPKWRFKVYDRFTVNHGGLREEDYVLTRDLHDWEVNMEYHQEHGGGTDLLISFTIKAFPDMGLDLFSTGFNKRKAGSQNSAEKL